MVSSFRQWELDPLFSAAEVVQDSADRMDSIYRLLLHERCLIQANRSDTKLLKSIEYYMRDLSTAVETAKWQLEDFEREVNISATMDKSHARENVISKHRQFISAIREQIIDLENTLRDTSADDVARGNERMTLHEHDTEGLASFILGDKVNENIPMDDSNSMLRFLDPTISSNLDDEIVEHYHDENNIRRVGSNLAINRNFEPSCSVQENPYETNNEVGCWDLEANQEANRSFFDESKLRGYNSRMRIFGFLPNLRATYWSRDSRSFTKKWKDGDEQTKSQYHDLQGNCRRLSLSFMYIRFQAWLSQVLMRCRRSPYYAQAKGYSMLLVPAIITTLIILGILLL